MWRMSVLLEMCPKDVREQMMMMMLDEIRETYENFKAKGVSYTTYQTEQTRGGQKELHVPMEEHHAGGSEPEEEGEDVDEVRRGSICYNCGMMGHLAKIFVEGKARPRRKLESDARNLPKKMTKGKQI